MKIIVLLGICVVALMSGGLFFAYHYGMIIIHLPLSERVQKPSTGNRQEKKTITLHYWHRNNWHKEETEILWSADLALSALQVTRTWLNLLDEENITSKKVSAQSALLNPLKTELYISFDRNPLCKEACIYEKLLWIEGLLKTFATSDLPFCYVHFLVHHQPINDNHLDFTHAWPGQGFLDPQN